MGVGVGVAVGEVVGLRVGVAVGVGVTVGVPGVRVTVGVPGVGVTVGVPGVAVGAPGINVGMGVRALAGGVGVALGVRVGRAATQRGRRGSRIFGPSFLLMRSISRSPSRQGCGELAQTIHRNARAAPSPVSTTSSESIRMIIDPSRAMKSA